MAIGSGVLLPGVAENPTFPILSALAYTTGLGYRPTCDNGYNLHSLNTRTYKQTISAATWLRAEQQLSQTAFSMHMSL